MSPLMNETVPEVPPTHSLPWSDLCYLSSDYIQVPITLLIRSFRCDITIICASPFKAYYCLWKCKLCGVVVDSRVKKCVIGPGMRLWAKYKGEQVRNQAANVHVFTLDKRKFYEWMREPWAPTNRWFHNHNVHFRNATLALNNHVHSVKIKRLF